MKNTIKNYLSYLGLFSKFDLLRHLPAIIRWLRGGIRGIAPPPIKRIVLAGYMNTYGLKQFVETGTFLGDTLAYIAQDNSIQATSIELDGVYFNAAKRRFTKYSNVTIMGGDSGTLMPKIVARLRNPALFWLDGHYSGDKTGKGDLETPVIGELQAIFCSPITGHVILIDDARRFDGTHDYPSLETLLATIRSDGRYHTEVSTDIIRLTPV